MVQVSGQEKLDQPQELIWQSLVRPTFLCQCFPGVDRVVRADDRSAAVVVRPGFSFVRGTLEVSFEFVEADPPHSARAQLHIKGIGSSAELEARLALSPDNDGTRINWSVQSLELGGLLKAVSQGLMQAAAQKVAADTWAEVRKRLERGS